MTSYLLYEQGGSLFWHLIAKEDEEEYTLMAPDGSSWNLRKDSERISFFKKYDFIHHTSNDFVLSRLNQSCQYIRSSFQNASVA